MLTKRKIIIVDDHNLIATSLTSFLNDFEEYEVIACFKNGLELIEYCKYVEVLPDLILLDISMPDMDGISVMEWINTNKPQSKILALSMFDDDATILKMTQLGVKGYLLKGSSADDLIKAINSIIEKGYYYSDEVGNKLISGLQKEYNSEKKVGKIELKEKEILFLKLACTEMTYKEIADTMLLSPKTIDGYRDTLFEKLEIKSRVGLVTYAIKNGYFSI
jgi:DNA-binding NarL/FixJ family response regulator